MRQIHIEPMKKVHSK